MDFHYWWVVIAGFNSIIYSVYRLDNLLALGGKGGKRKNVVDVIL